jgi:uncharacterized peroxidase-related enzyme
LRLTGGGNITKALEMTAGGPCKIFVHAVQRAKEIPMQSVKQVPIYLPDVENNPQPSHYADMIQKMQKSGGEYWQIWHLFAFRPETTMHLARFTEGIMREPAPVSSGLRELIAAYTSKLNECEFCMKSHAAVSSELLGDDLVRGVLRDLESSALDEKEKALLRFAGKVTKNLPSSALADIDELRNAGWNDEAIFYTITVCALFNFYNRWITASGVHAVSEEGHRLHGKVLAQKGYDPRLRAQQLANTER